MVEQVLGLVLLGAYFLPAIIGISRHMDSMARTRLRQSAHRLDHYRLDRMHYLGDARPDTRRGKFHPSWRLVKWRTGAPPAADGYWVCLTKVGPIEMRPLEPSAVEMRPGEVSATQVGRL